MTARFAIEIDWERLERGSPEDRATFGAIGLRIDGKWLSEAQDAFARRVREKVYLSGYQLAQWLAWNWWRLSWETTRTSPDWSMAHKLTTVGGGYIWPNVEVSTDGQRVRLLATPAPNRKTEPLRYVADVSEVLSSSEFRAGVESFVGTVVEQLRIEGIADTNLQRVWEHVGEEEADPQVAWYRRLEAIMGFDPDDAPPGAVDALIEAAKTLGEHGVAELAASAAGTAKAPTLADLIDLADNFGHEVRLDRIPQLEALPPNAIGGKCPAWVVGEEAARLLRKQEKIAPGPISDDTLAGLAGTRPELFTGGDAQGPFSFALRNGAAKIVLRPRHPASRRFALARLVADRTLSGIDEPFIPIMQSYSYRQKLQKAFAAELLLPFEEAQLKLDEELSDDSREDVAAEYNVSPMVVTTQLVNKGLLRRRELENF